MLNKFQNVLGSLQLAMQLYIATYSSYTIAFMHTKTADVVMMLFEFDTDLYLASHTTMMNNNQLILLLIFSKVQQLANCYSMYDIYIRQKYVTVLTSQLATHLMKNKLIF